MSVADARTSHRTLGVALASVVLAAAAFAVVAAVAPTAALAKSYVIDDVTITSQVQTNGDLDVSESRTFDFSGDYTHVYWVMPTVQTGGIRFSDFVGPNGKMYRKLADSAQAALRPPGTYMVTESAGQTRLDAYFAGTGKQTFKVDYIVSGAAKRYSDVAELYWKAIGSEWGVPTNHAKITVDLPSGTAASEVRAWAHGPLNGTVTIVPKPAPDAKSAGGASVVLDVSDLPASQFVEVRIAFSPASIMGAPLTPGGPRAPTILAEEKKSADAANAERAAAGAQVGLGWLGVLLASIAGLALAGWAWLKHGREHQAVFTGEYFRDIPSDDPPAVVGALMRWGTVDNADISATIIQMANDKALYMEPVVESMPGLFGGHDEKTYKLTVDRDGLGKQDAVARGLGKLIFDDIAQAETVTVAGLQASAKESPQSYKDGVDGWRSLVKGTAEARGWFDATSRSWMVILYVTAAAVAAITAGLTFWTGSWLMIPVGGAAAVIIAIMANITRRRSAEGADLYNKYKALEKYLKDFSRLDEAPPASVVLWNRFLVLAVVFGIAKEVLAQLKVALPQVVGDPGFATTYWMLSPGGFGGAPVDVLSTGFASAASTAASELSSASGAGGGFSGGGGGGFGGGGGGAD
jgi:uncharacterized membrane protein